MQSNQDQNVSLNKLSLSSPAKSENLFVWKNLETLERNAALGNFTTEDTHTFLSHLALATTYVSESTNIYSERLILISQCFLMSDCPFELKSAAFKIITNVVRNKPKILLAYFQQLYSPVNLKRLLDLSVVPGFNMYLNHIIKSTRGLLKKSATISVSSLRPFTSLSERILEVTLQIYQFCFNEFQKSHSLTALEIMGATGIYNNFDSFLNLDQIDDFICNICYSAIEQYPEQAFRHAATAAQSLRFSLLSELKKGESRASFFKKFNRSGMDRKHVLISFIKQQQISDTLYGKYVYSFHSCLVDGFDDLAMIEERCTPFLIFSYRKIFEVIIMDSDYIDDIALQQSIWNKVVKLLPECKEVEMQIALIGILNMIIDKINPFSSTVVAYIEEFLDSGSTACQEIFAFITTNLDKIDVTLLCSFVIRTCAYSSKVAEAQCRAVAKILEVKFDELDCDSVEKMKTLLIRYFKMITKEASLDLLPAIICGVTEIQKRNPFDEYFAVVDYALRCSVPKILWTVCNALRSVRLSREKQKYLCPVIIDLFENCTNTKVAIASGELILCFNTSERDSVLQALQQQVRNLEVPCQYRESLRAVHRRILENFGE